jgi:hypothetical protein
LEAWADELLRADEPLPPPAPPAQEPAPPQPPENIPEFVLVPDRWSIPFPAYPLNEPGAWYDPYHQNPIKGDTPLFGQNGFLIFTGRSDTLVETRQLPTPSGVSTARFGRLGFFGEGEQFFVTQTFLATVEIFEGETAFRPRDWELKLTGAANINYIHLEENALVNPDVLEGTDRTDAHGALQEASLEIHIADLSDDYDFMSIRVGIQPFVSDFRGLLFSDTNLAARLFGTGLSNRIQWNLAFFDQLEKDTNSDLNTFDRRHQHIYIANAYVQDFLWLGYTAQFSFHYSHDDASTHFDENDFLVRPDLAGSARPHDVDVAYFGWTGDGHIGRVNVTHALYYATGDDSLNPIAGRQVEIAALLAALEVSYDFDWLRLRGSFLFASGDRNPTDRRATGFDSIFENPNFAGGPFSFWNRQQIRLLGVNLSNRFSQLPNLRSSKTQGQINAVNPGIFIYNVGADIEVMPELKAIFNANAFQFHHTDPLELLVNQPGISRELGYEVSTGLIWRPWLNNNIVITAGAAGFFPGDGFEDLFEDDDALYQGFFQLTMTY